MADSDDASYSDSGSDGKPPAQVAYEDYGEEDQDEKKRRSGRKNTKSEHPGRVQLPTNLKAISGLLQSLTKKLCGQSIDASLSSRVVLAALKLQQRKINQWTKLSKGKRGSFTPQAVRKELCLLFSISNSTLDKILSSYFKKERELYRSDPRGNEYPKVNRIPRTVYLRIEIR